MYREILLSVLQPGSPCDLAFEANKVVIGYAESTFNFIGILIYL